MNSAVIVMAMALVFCQVAAYGDHLDYIRIARAVTPRAGKLVKFLEHFKTVLQTGNDTLGIPVMDPFVSVQEQVALEEENIDLKAILTNIKANGISDYRVEQGDFSLIGIKVAVHLIWPLIEGESDYILKGDAFGLSIYGHGNASVALKDLDVTVNLKFSIANGKLYVQNISSKVKIGALDFKATGLLDDEEMSTLLSTIISDMAPQLVEDYQEMITKRLNAEISAALNAFLKEMSLSDLLVMIS